MVMIRLILDFFFVVLFFQPNIHNDSENLNYSKKICTFNSKIFGLNTFFSSGNQLVEINFFYQLTYSFFFFCALYTFTFLPYGRFYNRLGGNIGMLGAYFYVFFYLAFTPFRKPLILELYYNYIYIRCNFLK